MGLADYEIGPATRDDIGEILDLQDRNLRSKGGALSVPCAAAPCSIAANGLRATRCTFTCCTRRTFSAMKTVFAWPKTIPKK